MENPIYHKFAKITKECLHAGLELQIFRGAHFQGHSRRAPKATILKNTIELL